MCSSVDWRLRGQLLLLDVECVLIIANAATTKAICSTLALCRLACWHGRVVKLPGPSLQISRDELETVREVKTKLTRLTMRVERVRKVWHSPA